MNEDNKYQKLVTEAIEYYKSSNKENINEILLDFLNKQNVTENEGESKKVISHTSDTIENISDNYDKVKLKRANEIPENPADIIRENLKNILKNTQDNEQKDFSKTLINEINNISGNTNNNEYDIVDSPVEYSKELTKDINSLIELDAITIDKLGSEISNDLPEVNKILDFNDFYNSEFNSKEEKNIKKILSVANYVAKKKKYITLSPNETDENIIEESIPYIVDKNLSQSKIYYKYGKKEITFNSAFDELIDRYTAILITVVENESVEIGQKVGAKVGAFVGSIFGPVGTSIGFQLGRVVGKAAGETVGKIISTGINEFSKIVKKIIKTGTDIVDTVYNKVKNYLKNLFA